MSRSVPQDLPRRLGEALTRIQILTDAAGRRAADDAGVSTLQMMILSVLVKTPGLRVGELASRLEVTPGTISVALNALEEKKLAKRSPDPNEHRAVRITATAQGRRKASDLDEWADESLSPIVEQLGATSAGASLAALIQVLDAAETRGLIDPGRMCSRCRHFGWKSARGRDVGRPHRCGLLQKDIGPVDLQVDCDEFETATAESLAERPSLLGGD